MADKLTREDVERIVKEAREKQQRPDLRGADLRGADLRGADLERANLRGAYLRGANLKGANLERTDLNEADLDEADLDEANLDDADLNEADLERAKLRRAKLRGVYLTGANLTGANLTGAKLRGVDLRGAYLTGAYLIGVNLERANLTGAYLRGVNLTEADLNEVYLERVNLERASLTGANLRGADLRGANLERANLERANLTGANLRGANLRGANLERVNLRGVYLSETIISDLDLQQAKGLEGIKHIGPSPISTSTLIKSQGQIPEKFLRGCGFSDWEIEMVKLYDPTLPLVELNDVYYRINDLKDTKAIQLAPCFISYNKIDRGFAEKLYDSLQNRGVRCWYDEKDLKWGEKLDQQIDEAIRLYDIFLLIISKDSMQSKWVKEETSKAIMHNLFVRQNIEKDEKLKETRIIPIRLVEFEQIEKTWQDIDDFVFGKDIQEYYIPDWRGWENEKEFDQLFDKLLKHITKYPQQPHPPTPSPSP